MRLATLRDSVIEITLSLSTELSKIFVPLSLQWGLASYWYNPKSIFPFWCKVLGFNKNKIMALIASTAMLYWVIIEIYFLVLHFQTFPSFLLTFIAINLAKPASSIHVELLVLSLAPLKVWDHGQKYDNTLQQYSTNSAFVSPNRVLALIVSLRVGLSLRTFWFSEFPYRAAYIAF